MKREWMSAVLLSTSLVVGCGGREAENTENSQANEGTSVAVAPEPGAQSNLQPPATPPPAVPSEQDTVAPRPGNSAARSTAAARGESRTAPAPASRNDVAPRPADRVEAAPSRAAEAPVPVVRTVTIPAGTALPLELTSAVSTETARVETPVSARLRRDVEINGVTVFPAGAVVNGEVIDVDRPGRVQGRARLGLRFTSVTVDGRREDIRTNPVTFQGEATKGEDATKIGAGAGIGAVIGGIVGGGDGAAKGAAIGGAAGTGAVLATRGRDVELQPGTDITATLASATNVNVR
jgi:hypothetical protein